MRLLSIWGILTTIAVGVSGTVFRYSLDSTTSCHLTNVVTKWLEEEDVVLVHAKTTHDENSQFQECVIKFGPSSDSPKKTVKVRIDSYYNNDCGVYLAVKQSPTVFFNEEVSTIFNYSCQFKPLDGHVFYADVDNNIKVYLQKKDKTLLNYNFILNITLVEHAEVTQSMSTMLVVSICVFIAIAIPGIGCIGYRYFKIRNLKQQYEADDAFQPRHLSHMAQESPLASARYSNLPLGDIEPAGSLHSQTCIVGSQGADGLCSVCHRHHDDFAHVVDMVINGEVMGNVESHHGHIHPIASHIRVTDRDNLSHRPDSRVITSRGCHAHNVHSGAHRHNQPLTQSTSRLGLRSSHPAPSGSLSNSGELMVDSDDDNDIDVSGNDLIPPSYDLCPPSYDEAVSMPKPDRASGETSNPLSTRETSNPLSTRETSNPLSTRETSNPLSTRETSSPLSTRETSNPLQYEDVLETDPLYQNIESLSQGVR